MHYPHFLTLLELLIVTHQTTACMHYEATFPYSPSLPFEATLTDNGITTCWLSTTYDQHSAQQIAFSEASRPVFGRRQEDENHIHSDTNTHQMRLAGSPSPPTSTNSSGSTSSQDEMEDSHTEKEKRGEKGGGENGGKELDAFGGIWLPWHFTCLDGYMARAGVGVRTVWYKAHGQEFEFVPGEWEDVLGEKWVYYLSLWC